jgi:hypothetical protein
MLLPMMRHGFRVTMLKPNNNPHTGRFLLSPSKRGTPASKSNSFFYIEAFCIINLFLKVRQLRFLFECSEMSAGCGTKNAT